MVSRSPAAVKQRSRRHAGAGLATDTGAGRARSLDLGGQGGAGIHIVVQRVPCFGRAAIVLILPGGTRVYRLFGVPWVLGLKACVRTGNGCGSF